MRYIGQHHEISVVWTDSYAQDIGALSAAFHKRHLEIYEYSEHELEWEIINLHLSATEKEPVNDVFPFEHSDASLQTDVVCGEPFGEKGDIEVNVYRRCDLNRELNGPALIHFDFTSVLIPVGFSAQVERDGVCVLRKKGV